MTAADLKPIIAILGGQYNLLVFLVILLSLSVVIGLIRLGIVIYRSVKGRMDRV